MVVAGVFLLLRISPLLEYSETTLLLLLWIGSLTAFMAATTGLFQNDLKRVIAYSTCSQLGMLMILELNQALGGDRRTKARNEQPTSGAHPRRARSRAGAGRGRGLRGCECVPSCRFFCCEKL
jgi:hypothetical protein